MVSHDVLRLEVKRLREQLNAKADEVFGLQNRPDFENRLRIQ